MQIENLYFCINSSLFNDATLNYSHFLAAENLSLKTAKITFLQYYLSPAVTGAISFIRYRLFEPVIYFPSYYVFLMLFFGGFQSFEKQVSPKHLVPGSVKLHIF